MIYDFSKYIHLSLLQLNHCLLQRQHSESSRTNSNSNSKCVICWCEYYFKGKSTTFHVDLESVLVVIVVSWSNKFLFVLHWQKAEISELCCSESHSWSVYMCQDALHHKKTVLVGSSRLLSIALEYFFYVILCSFQLRGFFASSEPENPLCCANQKVRGKQ